MNLPSLAVPLKGRRGNLHFLGIYRMTYYAQQFLKVLQNHIQNFGVPWGSGSSVEN